ncbi:hypothetical protein DL98DRAFT_512040 [Cadophora sp. DSE1049]|nr:hypothetical protein DL98DRAFT_512040 [Cadophora sp. DSE1049]
MEGWDEGQRGPARVERPGSSHEDIHRPGAAGAMGIWGWLMGRGQGEGRASLRDLHAARAGEDRQTRLPTTSTSTSVRPGWSYPISYHIIQERAGESSGRGKATHAGDSCFGMMARQEIQYWLLSPLKPERLQHRIPKGAMQSAGAVYDRLRTRIPHVFHIRLPVLSCPVHGICLHCAFSALRMQDIRRQWKWRRMRYSALPACSCSCSPGLPDRTRHSLPFPSLLSILFPFVLYCSAQIVNDIV